MQHFVDLQSVAHIETRNQQSALKPFSELRIKVIILQCFINISFSLSPTSLMSPPIKYFFIQVFGNKDTDGFYRAEIRGRVGVIPCNMVSEIQTEDDEMMGQLLKQGFLPLNTPVEKLGERDFLFPLRLLSLCYYLADFMLL